MSSPSVSDDGKWIWNGHKWLPAPSFNDWESFQKSVSIVSLKESGVVSGKTTNVTILSRNHFAEQIPTVGATDLEESKIEIPDQDFVNIDNKIGLFTGDVVEVLVDSVAATLACCVLVFITMFAYGELSADSSVAVSTMTVTDSNGLRGESVYEFFPDRTEISMQACFITWCPNDRVIEVQEPLPVLFCGSNTDEVGGYDCSGDMGRRADIKSLIFPSVLILFPIFFFGNYSQTLEEKPRVYSVRKVWAYYVGLLVVIVALNNWDGHISHIDEILSLAGMILNPGKLVHVHTLPNLIPEAIMFGLCYVVLSSSDKPIF